uniref:Uncharacterized protein n=1 Tax=Oryza glumipatula TaxID=40148 RepID=A0A0D9Y400_9ORYZ
MAIASGAAFSVRPSPAAARPCVAASASAAGAARFRGDGSGGGGGGKWWAPLLGWSGQPDYIDAQPAAREEARPNPMAAAEQRGGGGKRFGVLTEEKARQLRARMMETESFHDCMYHSAIASRLASAAPADDGKH